MFSPSIGSGVEAEKEGLLACEELRPYPGREFGWPWPSSAAHLQNGDLDGAEEAF